MSCSGLSCRSLAKIRAWGAQPEWAAPSVLLLYLVGLGGIPAAGQLKYDFCFSILGDRTGDANQQVYEQVWKDVDSLHPDFVINVGDTIQGGNDATGR